MPTPSATSYAVFSTRRANDIIHLVIVEENLNVKMCCALPCQTTGYGISTAELSGRVKAWLA